MFAVTTEPRHRLMHIRVEGFWDAGTMRAYVIELGRQARSLEPSGGCRRILVDMSRYPIQAQGIAEGHARIIRHGREEMRADTALVMTSSLSRLQAKRMADVAGHELFADEAAARQWLLGRPIADDPDPGPAR